MSTNFIIFGPMDQKLWVFEVFMRSMGRAGMCYMKPIRVDHMCQKLRAGAKKFILQRVCLGHPAALADDR
jgi:hypothetical protein